MKVPKYLAFISVVVGAFTLSGCAGAHFTAGVAPGPPVCPYGYYEAPPYNCAPDGYYAPEWFSGGVFIGAGPWFHGPEHFYGHVDHALDVRRGYQGPMPERGAPSVASRAEFHGQAMHDPRGREAPRGRR